MTKKEAGKKLYLQGASLQDISSILKVSYNTVSSWSSKEGWKQSKSEQLLREETSQERIWHLIDFQLKVIEKITIEREKYLSEIKDVDELKKSLIERGDIDALQKLFTTIKGKEVTWDQVVKTARELVEFIAEEDTTLAKRITPIINEWLDQKRELL